MKKPKTMPYTKEVLAIRGILGELEVKANDIFSALHTEKSADEVALMIVDLRYKVEQEVLLPLVTMQDQMFGSLAAQADKPVIRVPSVLDLLHEISVHYRGHRDSPQIHSFASIMGVAPSPGWREKAVKQVQWWKEEMKIKKL